MTISVFASRYGQPLNTIGWSTRLESQAELQAANEKLIANEDYLGWVSSHSDLFEDVASDPALDRRVVDRLRRRLSPSDSYVRAGHAERACANAESVEDADGPNGQP